MASADMKDFLKEPIVVIFIGFVAFAIIGVLQMVANIARYSREAYDFRWELCRVEKMYDPQAASLIWANGDGTQKVFPCPTGAPYHLD